MEYIMPTQLQEAQRRYRTALGMLAMTEANIKHLMRKYNINYTHRIFAYEFSVVRENIKAEWELAKLAYPAISRADSKKRSVAKRKARDTIQHQMSINGGGLE